MSGQLTRQQLYDRIKASSKESYILEEMKRLGFWKSHEKNTLEEALILKETELNNELTTLIAKDQKIKNQEMLLKEIHKQRMANAKAKREETKQKKALKKQEKAAQWKEIQEKEIIYLGENVSKGLQASENDFERLSKYQLPHFNNIADVALAMGITTRQLTYWAYHRKVSTSTHYYTFEIPKKSGGKRKIAAPKKGLKTLQKWVLENLLNKITLQEEVHGFTSNRSIVSNAKPHINKEVVINIDLKDFFPSIHFKRVKGLFRSLGYSEQIATVFSLICTQAENKEASLDGITYYIQSGNRILPQGSPASPALSNLIAYKLDKRLKGLAKRYGFTYTRYADDLSFSTDTISDKSSTALLHFAKKIISSEDFTVHPEKIHVMKKSRQQKVTGIVVNEKINIDRNRLRQFRALLHNISQNGWKDQKWGKAKNCYNAIEGYILFIQMVQPEKAKIFQKQLENIVKQYGKPQLTNPLPPQVPIKEEKQQEEQKQKQTSSPSDWWSNF